MSECPACGQRLRDDWPRCPRCGAQQSAPPEVASVVASSPSSSLTRSIWVGLGVAAVIGVAAIVTMRSGEPRASTPEPAPAPVIAAEATSEPKPIDASALGRSQGEDAQRAGAGAYASGDLASALTQFEAAVAAKPEDPEAQNNLGQVLVRLNRAADALPHFDEAVRRDSQKWAYRFNRARAYGALERWNEAAVEYRAAAEIFPDDYATRYNLGLVLLRQKQYRDAVTELERAVAQAPGEVSFLITLGTAHVGAEQPARARAVFQQFLELAPNDPEAPRVKSLIAALDAAAKP